MRFGTRTLLAMCGHPRTSGEHMGQVKKCRMCGETLYCQSCGTRQTPESPDRSKFTMLLTDGERTELKKKAKRAGKTLAAYIRDLAELRS